MTAPAIRGAWPLRDLPVLGWLLAAAVVAVLDPATPAPRWLLIHLLLLGAASHAILVWSRYFADALLHVAPGEGDRRRQSIRLLLADLGALAVLVGVTAVAWPLTLAGAAAFSGAVVWHGVGLARLLRHALGSRFAPMVRYYVAAAALLPVGAGLGSWLARGVDGSLEERVVLAHAAINLLGWVGLTVLGTLVTLWPTMLRTRIEPGAERAARRALPLLLIGIGGVAGGALVGVRLLAAAGLAVYLLGAGTTGAALVGTARRKAPAGFATWSVAAGLGWLLGGLALVLAVLVGGSWASVGAALDRVAPLLAVGFGAQVLLGALSYLLPVVLGGGPAVVRARNAVVDRGARSRVVVANLALLAVALPVPPAVPVGLVGLALGSWLPLLLLARQPRGLPSSVR